MTEEWPPKPPDVKNSDIQCENPTTPFAFSGHAQIYKIQDSQMVYKLHGSLQEYQFMKAAGDCVVRTYGRVIERHGEGLPLMCGYLMELETPLDPPAIPFSKKRAVADQMTDVVHKLHRIGIVHGDVKPENMLLCSDGALRLCDLGEARYVDEDLAEWDGRFTTNYLSPRRCQGWRDGDIPPPTIEDDLYGAGLSIWQLFTGRMPFTDEYMDDIMDVLERGRTVDVNEVEDESIRPLIWDLLQIGGATASDVSSSVPLC